MKKIFRVETENRCGWFDVTASEREFGLFFSKLWLVFKELVIAFIATCIIWLGIYVAYIGVIEWTGITLPTNLGFTNLYYVDINLEYLLLSIVLIAIGLKIVYDLMYKEEYTKFDDVEVFYGVLDMFGLTKKDIGRGFYLIEVGFTSIIDGEEKEFNISIVVRRRKKIVWIINDDESMLNSDIVINKNIVID